MKEEHSKKIFFLYPHSVIKDETVRIIMQNEYEVYLIMDEKKLFKLLKKYTDALVFINIDEGLSEEQWEIYIKKIQQTKELENIRIGILSYNKSPELQQKYLMEIGVSCGFIQLSQGAKKSTEIILKTLEVNEARGRRRFVRAKCSSNSRSTCNLRYKGEIYSGSIIDVSSAGIACQFDRSLTIPLRTYLSELQLRLKGVICMVDGVVGAIRQGANPLYVIMFDQRSMSESSREKLNIFVFKSLQDSINDELSGITVQF